MLIFVHGFCCWVFWLVIIACIFQTTNQLVKQHRLLVAACRCSLQWTTAAAVMLPCPGLKSCPNNHLPQDGGCRKLIGAVVSSWAALGRWVPWWVVRRWWRYQQQGRTAIDYGLFIDVCWKIMIMVNWLWLSHCTNSLWLIDVSFWKDDPKVRAW